MKKYTILTGGKNNAGDYLIKHRAKELFKSLRPDREIIDINGWEHISNSTLQSINDSEALILTGGPALQKKMYPSVYRLRDSLDEIEVPILTMGIGWYSKKGTWHDSYEYNLSDSTLKLLERINDSGYLSSVRDYHTQNVLFNFGLKNFMMTGCPALYNHEFINKNFNIPKQIKKIGFSLGVTFKFSKKIENQMKDSILKIKDQFPDSKIEVVFHHSPFKEYLKTAGAAKSLYKGHQRLLIWLKEQGIGFVDISGSAENLINYYKNCDLHIGYRVHAHIFMSSINKASILLSEDGRGIALEKVLGGLIFKAYDSVLLNNFVKGLHKFNIPLDTYSVNSKFADSLSKSISYELKHGIRFEQNRMNIDKHYKVMKNFIMQLP